MDNAPVSSSALSSQDPPLRRSNTSPTLASDAVSPLEDVSPTRQQRMLRQRNARFPAKKLSISGLSNKLTHLINPGESADKAPAVRNHENMLPKSKSTGTFVKSKTSLRSLSILEELSSSSRTRHQQQWEQIPIFDDSPERPLLESSPAAVCYSDFQTDGPLSSSPVADNLHDCLTGTHLREIDPNSRRASHGVPYATINLDAPKHPLSTSRFDHDQYIEHLELELQDARNEACSPLTRRPLKEKLRVVTRENESLQRELNLLKERFETEVKKTVEHKTAMEVALRRKVRDLESVLEDKENLVRQLQDAYEERRLDFNTVEVLRNTIERLETDKQSLEEINLGMSKRNEVLTQLLAMSPPKTQQDFQFRSPVRDKRHARPMSLILPRLPRSPQQAFSAVSASSSASPHILNDGDVSPLKLSPTVTATDGAGTCGDIQTNVSSESGNTSAILDEHSLTRSGHQGSWDSSATVSNNAQRLASVEDGRAVTKRKPRRFMAGSTQLKPLLLPALTGESGQLCTESGPSSPCPPSSRRLSVTSISSLLDDSIVAGEHSFIADDMLTRNQDTQLSLAYSPSINDTVSQDIQRELSYSVSTASGLPSSPIDRIQQRERIARVRVTSLHEQLAIHAAEVSALFEQSTTSYPSSLRNTNIEDPDVDRPMPLFSPEPSAAVSEIIDQGVCDSLQSSPLALLNSRKRRKPSQSRPMCSTMRTPPLPFCPVLRSAAITVPSPSNELSSIRSTNSFVGLITPVRKDARTLTALGIGTVYQIIANCAKEYHRFRQDPFALARRVIANAWRMNWKVFGKLSWWVLGLFIHPCATRPARAPIEWDQYDGESIADKYYKTPTGQNIDGDSKNRHSTHGAERPEFGANPRPVKWAKSLLMWGKFSFAVMLALGGAVVKGPNDMMKDIKSIKTSPSIGSDASGHVERTPRKRTTNHKVRNSRYGKQTVSINSSLESQEHTKHMTPEIVHDPLSSLFEFRGNVQTEILGRDYGSLQSDNDATLRAVKRPRTHVENFFNAPYPIHSGPGDCSSNDVEGLPDGRKRHIFLDDDILGWPSTDLALNSRSFSERHEADKSSLSMSSEETTIIVAPHMFA